MKNFRLPIDAKTFFHHERKDEMNYQIPMEFPFQFPLNAFLNDLKFLFVKCLITVDTFSF